MKTLIKLILVNVFSFLFFLNISLSQDQELREILENIQKDLRTLERAVYSQSFSEKLQSTNNQVDMLSEDFTGSIRAESGQMVSRPANSPNTTVTVIKQPTSNTPITNLMRNNYLSLNKKQQTELLKYIK